MHIVICNQGCKLYLKLYSTIMDIWIINESIVLPALSLILSAVIDPFICAQLAFPLLHSDPESFHSFLQVLNADGVTTIASTP